MRASINFAQKKEFKNHFDQEKRYLVRADVLKNHQEYWNQLIRICNQNLIYESLFRSSLKGRRYTESNAKEFLSWACLGWENKTHFVFFVLDDTSSIVGAIDIKSSNLKNAEIGYWADSREPGNITNALITILNEAELNGFEKFAAFVKVDNLNSSRVLKRADFKQNNKTQKEGYLQFEKSV